MFPSGNAPRSVANTGTCMTNKENPPFYILHATPLALERCHSGSEGNTSLPARVSFKGMRALAPVCSAALPQVQH